jgi:hypothetical protein
VTSKSLAIYTKYLKIKIKAVTSLEDKVALITGSARGLGKAIA